VSLSSGLAGPTGSTVEGVNEFAHRQPAWLQRLRRIRWPLRPGRPRRPSIPADQGRSSRVGAGRSGRTGAWARPPGRQRPTL